MFLTANSIVINYGVAESIAKFFVDREPPKDNLYWKGKELYLRPQPGYIFLPLVVDLFNKAGVSIDELLSEEFVSALEQIGHYSAEQEFGVISKETTINECAKLVRSKNQSELFLQSIVDYFGGKNNSIRQLTTPFAALHRGDFFLFAIAILNINSEKQLELVKLWFALISTLLLLDDAEDFEQDKKNGEENAFLQSGVNKEGFNNIKRLLSKNLDTIASVNKQMADGIHKSFGAAAEKPFIKQLLNS
jgi:hypothetical protein